MWRGAGKFDSNSVVFTGTGNYTMTNEVTLVLNKATGAATTVTLPANPRAGQRATIKDGKRDARQNNITIQGAASATIDGLSTVVIKIEGSSVEFEWNGSEWNLVGCVLGSDRAVLYGS